MFVMRNSLKLFVLLAILSLTLLASGCSRFTGPKSFTGRVTMMESAGSSGGVCAAPTSEARLKKIATLVQSRDVCKRASTKLKGFGVSVTPDEIKKYTSVRVLKDTNILALEARSMDATDAKVIADVTASEAIAVYDELNKSWAKKTGVPESKAPRLKVVDPAYVMPTR